MTANTDRLTVRELRAVLDELLDDRMVSLDTLVAATSDPEGNNAHPICGISRGGRDKRGDVDLDYEGEFAKDEPAEVLLLWAGY